MSLLGCPGLENNEVHQSSMGRLLSLGFSEASGENRFFPESSGSAELEKEPQA